MEKKLHYGWIVIFMGLITTVAAHGFGRMAYTLLLPAMKDGLQFDYTQLGLLGTGNFIGYLTMAIIGGFLAARFGTRIVVAMALVLNPASYKLTMENRMTFSRFITVSEHNSLILALICFLSPSRVISSK